MNDSPGITEQIIARLEALELRVSALEHQPLPPVPKSALPQPIAAPPATLDSVSIFSVLGRAMLGIAGAYLLRAAAESNLIPSQLAGAIAVPYALVWLVFAVRAGARLPAILYSATSALILAPLLWELTFRFQILAAPAGAAVIALYVCSATILAWRRNLSSVLWIANSAAVLITLSLFLASRSTIPFVAVLLLMLAIAIFAESRNRAPGLRALTALAASVAIWAVVYIYISPPNTRPDYPALSSAALILPAFVLFAVYLVSVVHSTIVRRRRITILEIVQTTINFLLIAVAFDAFGPPPSLIFFGVLCLLLAAAGYAAVYLFFDRTPAPRNYRVFSTWSAALVLIGCAISLPGALQPPSLSLAAVASTALGARFSRLALIFHGALYLAASAALSGLAAYILHALTGPVPAPSAWPIYIAFIAAIAGYALLPHPRDPSWQQQVLQLFFAALAITAVAAFLVHGAIDLLALRIQPGPHHLALFRTLSACAATLALAWAGARFSRSELKRIANAALVLLAIKILAEDLRHGRLAYVAASICLFALTLIAVPRLTRVAQHRSNPLPPAA